MNYTSIVSSHINPNLSGVAKFNHMLAIILNIPCIGIDNIYNLKRGPVLLSIKLRDINFHEFEQIKRIILHFLNKKVVYDIFFHTFDGLEIEYKLLENCRQVFCGNDEITHALQGISNRIISAWCPPLLDTKIELHESRLNLFSFGMAHKIQIKYYKILHELLQSQEDYSVWVSTAFHEKANFGDFNSISTLLMNVFGNKIHFLGFLSDEAVNYFLSKTQLFVAFFEKGVRANNTSVFAAMTQKCAVLTNCDEYSPSWMKHCENILDINQIHKEDLNIKNLEKIGAKAQQDVRNYASWNGLIKLLSKVPTVEK